MRKASVHRVIVAMPVVATSLLLVAGCGAQGTEIEVSGSSTVAPITEAIARDGGFNVTVTAEGTTDGFARFCTGETPLNNASEAIPGAGQRVDYVAMCAENGVEFIELPIGIDALSVVRNEANRFAQDLSVSELREIWAPGSAVSNWSDVRDEWPDTPIGLYGRPDGSGTFDYFTHFIVGEAGSIRDDYQSTDAMDELTQWIADDENALGFLGIGNYLSADEDVRDRITNVAVDGVFPSLSNAQDGRYTPLTRPLFVYVSTSALEENPEVASFVEHYLKTAQAMLPRVYFYPLQGEVYPLVQQRFDDRITGTLLGGDPYSSVSIIDTLQAQ
ncbi:PstS family phosphate ABC transporter substrate-binding protein [Hoyosella rhizosphaerae]|uniref:Protein sphX n=1 Tax=Hoyosella rhizosphaerae TaxID=1755582 RepID=A0A916U830_9ACTN|nr:PstS family phosphate ABC transporter substrate-binding protein [Hoyosella rhizosphaerae]MBN4927792.1 PstS family phosphate ABC transporter substrate-binding protein [Hoyosella rhizosphaerae]GGC61493.1 protein sphX [Hoyosella rhizosphaerae]